MLLTKNIVSSKSSKALANEYRRFKRWMTNFRQKYPLISPPSTCTGREPVFSKGIIHQLFCHTSFSKEEQFSSKFFEESFFYVPNYIIISLQVTSPRTMKTTSLTRIYSNCLQSFIPEQYFSFRYPSLPARI